MKKNESQHRLLVKLSERLTVAADYFHQLKLAGGEAAGSGSGEQVGKVIEAVKSPKPRTRKTSRKQKKRSEEHTSELQSLMRISYAVFCLKTKNETSKKQRTRRHD